MGNFLLFLLNFQHAFANFSYPPRYVYSRFSQFIVSNLRTSSILPNIPNENEFHHLRCLLLNRPTIAEYQATSRIARSIKNNTDERGVAKFSHAEFMNYVLQQIVTPHPSPSPTLKNLYLIIQLS